MKIQTILFLILLSLNTHADYNYKQKDFVKIMTLEKCINTINFDKGDQEREEMLKSQLKSEGITLDRKKLKEDQDLILKDEDRKYITAIDITYSSNKCIEEYKNKSSKTDYIAHYSDEEFVTIASYMICFAPLARKDEEIWNKEITKALKKKDIAFDLSKVSQDQKYRQSHTEFHKNNGLIVMMKSQDCRKEVPTEH